jgi:hypothetical protein
VAREFRFVEEVFERTVYTLPPRRPALGFSTGGESTSMTCSGILHTLIDPIENTQVIDISQLHSEAVGC